MEVRNKSGNFVFLYNPHSLMLNNFMCLCTNKVVFVTFGLITLARSHSEKNSINGNYKQYRIINCIKPLLVLLNGIGQKNTYH